MTYTVDDIAEPVRRHLALSEDDDDSAAYRVSFLCPFSEAGECSSYVIPTSSPVFTSIELPWILANVCLSNPSNRTCTAEQAHLRFTFHDGRCPMRRM
jgi:hypothetical protein